MTGRSTEDRFTLRRPRTRTYAAILLCCLLAFGSAVGADLRVASYNVQRLGDPGSPEYQALVEILQRVGADVVMIQEVSGSSEVARVGDLAADAGYGHHCVSETSGTLSGGLRTASLSRVPLVQCISWSAAELSGDQNANDITRDIFEVHARVDPNRAVWGVFTSHIKSGSTNRDKFRRQVEIQRAMQAVSNFMAANPGAPVVFTGDLNEDIGDGPFGQPVFDQAPAGLPSSYELGSDIAFPVVYDPFVTITAEGLAVQDASHEDAPGDDQTRWASGRRLDYLCVDLHAGPEGTEVYDACDDNGVDDPPPGNFLAKTGSPLACGREQEASDHLDVFADVQWLAVDQDGDGIDDARDCAALDSGDGRPGPISGLRAQRLPSGHVRFSWDAATTADRYDLIGGGLPANDVAGAPCRTSQDPDPSDTVFDDSEIPAPGSGGWLLVRGVDNGCGGAGTYSSGHGREEARPNESCP